MFNISGPEYVSIFRSLSASQSAKTILIFGDEHFNTDGLCKDCTLNNKCLHIIDFIEMMNKKRTLDLFLEAPYATKDVKGILDKVMKNINSKGILSNVVSHFHNYLYKKHKNKQSLRVHYSDFRFHSSLDILKRVSKTLQDKNEKNIMLPLVVLTHFKSPNTFKMFADACVKKDNFIEYVKNIFNDKAPLYTDKDHLTSFNNGSKTMHRIRKQIKKVSPQMQRALVKFHNKQCKDIMQDAYNSHYKTARRVFLEEHSYEIEDLQVLYMTIKNWLFHLMDMYLLARVIYYIENNNSSNIVIFTGTNHSINYDYFFNDFVSSKMFKKEWECNKGWNLSDRNIKLKRCVQIPEGIIENILGLKII